MQHTHAHASWDICRCVHEQRASGAPHQSARQQARRAEHGGKGRAHQLLRPGSGAHGHADPGGTAADAAAGTARRDALAAVRPS